MSKKGNFKIGDFFQIMLGIVVALALFPTVQQSVTDANATGQEGSLLNLTTLLYVIAVAVIVIVPVARALKRMN